MQLRLEDAEVAASDSSEQRSDLRSEQRSEQRSDLRVLYIVYWGLLEPLGQALVLPPVLRVADAGNNVTLVTFEKPHHISDRAAMEKHRALLRQNGIDWLPLLYHQRPTAPATAFDITHGAARSILKSLCHRPHVVHGRTYVGGVIGTIVSRLLRRPFVFHNEGFWPDEQVDAGKWSAQSRAYHICKRVENGIYRKADGVIALSQWARQEVMGLRSENDSENVIVVPSCVDLAHFSLVPSASSATGPDDRHGAGECRLVYAGGLGGRYPVGDIAAFLQAARRVMPGTTLNIYSQQSAAELAPVFAHCGIPDDAWSMRFLPYAQMPQALASASAGLHFLRPGVNRKAGSPTKIGEYWACGLPVVTSPQVSDVDAIVRRERVGVLLAEGEESALEDASLALRELLRDPELPERCRRAAECHYNIESGVAAQLSLYRRLLKHPVVL